MIGTDTATPRRIVVVGASLAGLRGAEALRDGGFTGEITVVGDEPYEPYDRPPLSKAVLSGWLTTEHTALARIRDIDARWLLGAPAVALDPVAHEVWLAGGARVPYDRLLAATGTRARELPGPTPAGVHVLRTRDDADRLRAELSTGPRRVLVIGGGFTGCEVASACRALGLEVTLVHRGHAPLASALGTLVGDHFAGMQRAAGVDLRLGTTVLALDAAATGRLTRAHLSDGDVLDVDVAVVALGSVANVEWLSGAGLSIDERGVVCDATCRVVTTTGAPRDDVFAAGDVARWPHPLHDGRLVTVNHWGNAVDQARTAAHNMLCAAADRRHHGPLPTFWSDQFGSNIKSVGLPWLGDQAALTQGSPAEGRFVVTFGRRGRLVGTVAVNSPRVMDGYAALIHARSPFPPDINAADGPAQLDPIDAGFPPLATETASASVALQPIATRQ